MTEEATRGRTRWGRFGAILAAGGIGAGVLLFGLSQGALAASFTVAGEGFKATVGDVKGTGLALYGGVDQSAGQPHAAATVGVRNGTASDLCLSAYTAKFPIIGDLTLKVRASAKGALEVNNLVINVDQLSTDLVAGGVDVGADASKLTKGPQGATGVPGTFGVQADSVETGALRASGRSVTATTVRLKGLSLSASASRDEC